MLKIKYGCVNCKLPSKSKFGGFLPMIIINGVIITTVLIWSVIIKIKSPTSEPVYEEESDILIKSPEDKLIMTKSNKKYLLKINANRSATRPSTIFTVH